MRSLLFKIKVVVYFFYARKIKQDSSYLNQDSNTDTDTTSLLQNMFFFLNSQVETLATTFLYLGKRQKE